MQKILANLVAGLIAALWLAGAQAAPASGTPVRIGFDGEFSVVDSTSAQAIELGIRVAMDEINAAGGVLGGRPLELVTKDNRINPARGVANLTEFAAVPDLVAVFGGRFSPVMSELVKPAHAQKVVLLAPWASATGIIDNGMQPNYAFRLALHDQIAMPAMIDRARSIGRPKLGLMLANTNWGRSNREAAEHYAAKVPEVKIVGVEWHNFGDESLLQQYTGLIERGAQAILVVISDKEGVSLLRQIAALDAKLRVPVIAHQGLTGGGFFELVGADTLSRLDFSVIQTFSLFRADPQKVRRVMDTTKRLVGISRPEGIASPIGFGHAYDLTHILARAINLAGSTDRAKVRDALEQVRNYSGLLRKFDRPFTPERHEALQQSDVFFARFRADGALIPVERGSAKPAQAARRP
jgi:branched-chain amino acid transport system substrate-binding protein